MIEEALKLADEIDEWGIEYAEIPDMIRKLVAELEEVTRQSSEVSSKPKR